MVKIGERDWLLVTSHGGSDSLLELNPIHFLLLPENHAFQKRVQIEKEKSKDFT